jgi:hypothetical protein
MVVDMSVELNKSKMCTSSSSIKHLHVETLKFHAWWTYKQKTNFQQNNKINIKLHACCACTHKKPSNELELKTFDNRVKWTQNDLE